MPRGDERELRSRSRRPGQRQSSNASTDPPTPAEGGGRKLRFLGALFTGKDAPVSSPVLDDSIPTLAPSSTACAALPAPVSILTVPVSSPTVPVSSPTIDSLAPPATAIPSTPAIPSPTQEIVSPTPPTITPPSKLVSPASATVVPPQTAIPTLATVTPSPVAAPTPTQSWGRRCSKELLRFVQTLRCISTPPAIDSPTPTIDTLTEAAVILTPATVAPIETAILPTWAIDPAAPTVSVTPTIITPPSEARRPDPAGILPAAAIVAPSETAILPTPAIDPIAPTLPSTPATITPPSEAISLTPAAILPIPAAILPIPAIDLAAPTLPSTPANITPPPVVGPPTVAVILPAPAIVAPSETTIIPTSAIDPAALPLPPSPSAILPTPAIQPSTQIQSPPPVLTVPIPIWHVDGTSSGDTSMVECDPKIHLEFNTVVLPNIQQLINKSLYKKKAFFCVELVMCEDRPTVLITCRSVRDMRRLIAKTNCIDQRKFSVKFLEGGVSYAAAPGGSNLFGNGMYRSGSGIPISAYRGKRTLGTALLGGYIEIDGQYFGLTVSHVLDEETEDSDSGETSDQSSDRTSSTSSSTRISDDDDDDDDGDRRLKPRVTEDHIELSDIRISVRDDHKMTAVHCASGNRVSRSANTGVDHRDATSYIMDWALISPPQMVGAHFHPPNVFHDAQTDSRGSDASHPIISTGHLASKSVKIIMNGSVYCHGTASGVPSLVSLRNQPGLGLVFMVMTSRELARGMSGAWAVDSTTSELLGYLHATSTSSPWAYFIPIIETLDDIMATVSTTLPSLPHGGNEGNEGGGAGEPLYSLQRELWEKWLSEQGFTRAGSQGEGVFSEASLKRNSRASSEGKNDIHSIRSMSSILPTTDSYLVPFERTLLDTRVYRKVKRSGSMSSSDSSARKGDGWSQLSGLSLSEISNISVVNLKPVIVERRASMRRFTRSIKEKPPSPQVFHKSEKQGGGKRREGERS